MKPISYLKAHAAGVISELNDGGEPLVVTQNGEAKMVVQDIRSFERTQETIALLKILALGKKQVEDSKVLPSSEAFQRLRKHLG